MRRVAFLVLTMTVVLAATGCSAASSGGPASASAVPSSTGTVTLRMATPSIAPSAVPARPSLAATPAASPKPSPTPTAKPPGNPPVVTRHAVSIAGYSFGPAKIVVPAGSTVIWTNHDMTDHTVTSDGGRFASSTLAPGARFSHTFRTAGTFAYHCSIHPYMTGTITVR
jgi:plastocyanin